jgi:hypothetical protein
MSHAIVEKAANTVRATCLARLRGASAQSNLFMYDGTVLDRLAAEFVAEALPGTAHETACAIRPCMHAELRNEVIEYASRNCLPLLGYEGDCDIDQATRTFVVAKCDNVTGYIRGRLHGKNGLLIVSSLLNETWGQEQFQRINSELQSFEFSDRRLVVAEPGVGSQADWRTLFLFHGFQIAEILAAYWVQFGTEPKPHHIPRCYLTCHNERQQRVIADVIQAPDRRSALLKLLSESEI